MMAARHAPETASERGTPERAHKAALLAGLAVLAVPMLLAALPGCAPKPRIAGTINTTDYVIAPGQVVTAVGDVTIIATHRIEIYGVLEVAHGARVRFKSPTVTIPGRLQYQDKYVGWRLRSKFLLNRVPEMVTARLDRMLGRTPNYWARGGLDCFSPVGRAAALSAAPGGKGPRTPGWRWKRKLNASVEGGSLSGGKTNAKSGQFSSAGQSYRPPWGFISPDSWKHQSATPPAGRP